MEILEVWGNKTDVVIKYKREGFNNIWIKASKWMKNNSDMSSQWLIKNGYRRIEYEV